MADTPHPIFGIEKVYIKDCSLEIPHAPEAFLIREDPKLDLDIQPSHQKINDTYYEVSVRATVTAKFESDDRTLFICEVTQSGIFQIENMPDNDLEIILEIAGPNIVFPYLRQSVSLLTSNGGFPSVNLAPFNFEQHYKQRQESANGTVQ